MTAHFKTLVWVNWVKYRHRILALGKKRSGRLLAGIVLFFVGCGIFGIGIGGFVAGWATADEGFVELEDGHQLSGLYIMLAMDFILLYFLMFWCTDMIVELQRAESIDFRRMLYLPISLRTVFLLNFGISVISPTFIFFMIPLTTFSIAMAIRLGPQMLLGIPLGFMFYVMLAAWSYYVMGLISFSMRSKRKRQMLISALSFVFFIPMIFGHFFFESGFDEGNSDTVDLSELPGYGVAISADGEEGLNVQELMLDALDDEKATERMYWVASGNSLIPFGWFPLGLAMTLEGHYWVTLQCLSGLSALAFFGLYFGYRSTLQFYTTPPVTSRKEKVNRSRRSFGQRVIELNLPKFDSECSAVAFGSFLNCIRNPILLGALVPVIMMGTFFFVFRSVTNDPDSGIFSSLMTELMPTVIVMFPFLGVINLFTNIFGLDLGGFRAYVLMPASRWKYLLGINVMLASIAISITTVMILGSTLVVPMGFTKMAISGLQTIQLAFTFCIIGNITSIYFPYHTDMRGTRPTFKQQMTIMVVGFSIMFLLGILSIPIGIAMLIDGVLSLTLGYTGVSVGLLVSVAMVVATAMVYGFSLPRIGTLLQEREIIILNKLMKLKP